MEEKVEKDLRWEQKEKQAEVGRNRQKLVQVSRYWQKYVEV